ncbi:hypothetical protein ACFWVC_10060 [Streptomyces sp. NPDC058691]|uniref:hypothetical protein n=1 Tax=Streptomyces sp. NPDC058691 TaxID=3346601 RepID=UPI003650E20D
MRGDTSRRALALIASVAALSGGLAVTPALADDAGPVVIGAARTVDDQRGTFTVPAWTDAAGAALTSVTATVREGDTVVADDLALTPSGDRWAVPSDAPLKLTEDGGTVPHLGRYAIDVTATDDQGHSTTRADAGTLDFTLRPVLQERGFTASVLDFTHRETGATGTLEGIQPGSGDMVPVEGRTVTVTMVRNAQETAPLLSRTGTTDAGGGFATPDFTVPGSRGFFTTFTEDGDEVHGSVREFSVPSSYQWIRATVTAKADRTRALPGQKITISGTVRDDVTGLPVPGAEVTLGLNSVPEGRVVVTTGASGAFSGAITAVPREYGSWYASVTDGYISDPYGAGGPMVLPEDGAFTNVSSKIDAQTKVTVSAKLWATYNRDLPIGTAQLVHLEYSKDGKAGWTDLGTAHSQYNGGTVTVSKWGHLDGYYRLHHFTSNQLADTVSKPVRLTRTNTRMYSIKASATKVKKGATVTFTGTLKEYVSGTWRPYKSKHVELFFQKKGSTKWTYVASATTSSTGKATLKGKPASDGKWLIQYFGDSKHFDSDGTAVYVDVR